MLANQNATSTFFHNNNELFVNATLNISTHRLSFEVLNEKGIRKMKRSVKFPCQIVQIFPAQKYIIGLSENHESVLIIDISKMSKNMYKGQIPNKSNFHKIMHQKRLRFNQFYYDSRPNIILGLLERKYIYVFNIPEFQYSDDSKSLIASEDIQIQRQLQIKQLYVSANNERIDKFQIAALRFNQKNIKNTIATHKSQIPNLINSDLDIQKNENNDKNKGVKIVEEILRPQQVKYQLKVLCKQKSQLKTISINWDKFVSTIKNQTPGVLDFCFRNDWNIIISSKINETNNQKKKNKPRQIKSYNQLYDKLQIQASNEKGAIFKQQIRVSGEQIIYTSNDNFTIVDPKAQQILTVQKRKIVHFYELNSIPSELSHLNSMLKVISISNEHTLFIFEKFNGHQFERTQCLLRNFNKIQEGQTQGHYLHQNIQKIFTINGLIHSYFKQNVSAWLKEALNHDLDLSDQNMHQLPKQQMIKQIIEQDQNLDQICLVKKTLQRIIMRNPNYVTRLLNKLLDEGLRPLFSKKSTKINTSLRKTSTISISQNTQKSSHLKAQHNNSNFDEWDKLFSQMIYGNIQILKNKFQEAKLIQKQIEIKIEEIKNKNSEKFYKHIQKNKRQLSVLSTIYTRFQKQLSTLGHSQLQHQQQLLFTYLTKIKNRLNIIHSLFLIFDMLELFAQEHIPSKQQEQVEKDIEVVFSLIVEEINTNKISNQHHQGTMNQNKNQGIQGAQKYLRKNCLMQPLLIHEHFQQNIQPFWTNQNQMSVITHFINYLLTNLQNFQQIAYFYNLVFNKWICHLKQEIDNDKYEHNKQYRQRQYKHSQRQQKGRIVSYSYRTPAILQKPKIFPYMNQTLLQFLVLIQTIPQLSSQVNFEDIQSNENKLIKCVNLSLKLNVLSFTKYMCQLCVFHDKKQLLRILINSQTFSIYKHKVFVQEEEKMTDVYHKASVSKQNLESSHIDKTYLLQHVHYHNIFVINSMLWFKDQNMTLQCLRWILNQKDFLIKGNNLLPYYFSILVQNYQIRFLHQIINQFKFDNEIKNEVIQMLKQKKINVQEFQDKINKIKAESLIKV